jgi:hypothetical protein
MPIDEQQARLEEAFDRIEETILPCIAMMLEILLEASKALRRPTRRRSPPNCKSLRPSWRNSPAPWSAAARASGTRRVQDSGCLGRSLTISA